MATKKKISLNQAKWQNDEIHQAVDFAGVGLYRYKLDGTMLFINSVAFYLFDLDKAYKNPVELKGKKLNEVIESIESERDIRLELDQTGFVDNFIYKFRTVGGENKYVILNAFLLREDITGDEYINAMIYDVTETMNYKLKFENLSDKYRAVVESFNGLIYISTHDYKIDFMNKKMLRQIDYYGKNDKCYKVLYGRDNVCPWCVTERVSKGETVNWEVHIPNNNKWFSGVSSPIFNKDGTVSNLSLFQDITTSKQAGKELRMLGNIPEQVGKGLVIRNFNDELLFYNKYWVQLYGLETDKGRIKKFRDVYSEDFLQKIKQINQEVITKGYFSGEIGYKRKNGTECAIQLTTTLYKDERGFPAGFVDVAVDITERKLLEKELIKVQDLSNGYLDAASSLIIFLDRQLNVTYINKKGCDLIGYDKHEVIGKNWFDSFVSQKYSSACKSVYEQIVNLNDIQGCEYFKEYIITKSGEERLFNFNNYLICSNNAKVESIFISGEDITEQVRMEQKVKESEEKYRSLVENINVGVYRITSDFYGKFIHANKAMLDIFGYSSLEEFLNLTIFELYYNFEDRSVMLDKLNKNGSIRNEKICLRRKDGSPIVVSCTAKAVYDENNNIKWFDGIIDDITDHEKLDEVIRIREKLEALKVVAGGIVHDFNNLLTGIFGYITMAKYYSDPESQVAKMLDESEKACNRARELSNQMLVFSRFGRITVKPICPKKIIEDTTKSVLKKFNLNYKIDIEKSLWKIEIDEFQFHQVIYNIVLNAAQATNEGGNIRISATNLDFNEFSKDSYPINADPSLKYIKITVVDNGCGIPDGGLNKIYDPFYTTKDGNCGLGLPAVYLILKKNSGFIDVQSKTGQGTEVEIYLPAYMDLDQIGEQIEKKTKLKILIMDSDFSIRNMLENVLNRIGFSVTCVADEDELVKEYMDSPGLGRAYDVVIPDLRSDEDSQRIAKKLINIDSNVKLIAFCCDGYHIDKNAAESWYSNSLQKPFRIEELIHILNSFL